MGKTLTISIGNSDNKLSQEGWSNFVSELRQSINSMGHDMHFFGFTAPDTKYQRCTAVCSVEMSWIQSNGWTFEEWMDNVVKPNLADLAKRYDQESIALTIGETEFVMAAE